jgi:glyoxylase-like metal-dependent hydrolase (beta-lactamase superfamily II)/rhodanese-related sulfurtransferase
MIIEQFYDTGLAQGSYVIISGNEAAVIDPSRDPQPYYDFVNKHDARIRAVIETHPHADFVSGHLEISKTTGAPIYVSRMLGAEYAHKTFDDGDALKLGKLTLKAMNTPGHSPDSISILLMDEAGNQHALFSGDTLFVGDVGRPDLRENVGNIKALREDLARSMYSTIQDKLKALDESVLVYPSHGAGSLCGKNLSSDLHSTIGREFKTNYAFREMPEEEFVNELIQDQPFIPKYFGYDVNMNKRGADSFLDSVHAVHRISSTSKLEEGFPIIDARKAEAFRKGHLPKSINLMDGGKFETWLGSIIGPNEQFYLTAASEAELDVLIRKAAKIGYEKLIKAAFVIPSELHAKSVETNPEAVRENPEQFTIVDIRNASEVAGHHIFHDSIEIPLSELRERLTEIPTNKPILVHCAGGYRSAAGASIIQSAVPVPVYDLSDAVLSF